MIPVFSKLENIMKKLIHSLLALCFVGVSLGAEPVAVGQRMPDLKTLIPAAQIPDTKGKVVLVDFWASWCAPCRASFPALNELQKKYGARGLVIIGVGVDRDRGDYEKFARKMKAAFPLVHDVEHRAAAAFGPATMPTSYLVDRKGVVRHVHTGFKGAKTTSQYTAEIEALLGAKR